MRKNIKIKSVSFEVKVGQVYENLEKVKEIIKSAEEDKVNILSFPELTLTGASLYDGYLERDILNDCEDSFTKLVEMSRDLDILFTIGLPIEFKSKLYNAMFIIKTGEVIGAYIKTNLKDYEKHLFDTSIEEVIKVGNEYIYVFNDLPVNVEGIDIGLSIGEEELKTIPKSLELKNNHADIILNPCADEKFALKIDDVIRRIEYLSKDVMYVYTSSGLGESTTDFVYSGLNFIADDGNIVAQSEDNSIIYIKPMILEQSTLENRKFNNYTTENPLIYPYPYLPKDDKKQEYIIDIMEIGARGLLTRMEHIGVLDVFIGVSGGLDSAIALLIINYAYEKKSLSKDKIHAYTMPAFGTSSRTKSNAFLLCEALDIKLNEINISQAVKVHLTNIGHDMDTADAAYENAQARERTQVLFNLANMYNGIVIGTGDLSENMQGFATYNGDHMSNYSLNATIMKTEIRYILDGIANNSDNEKLKKVLLDILDTPISPELVSKSEGKITQKTEDIIGPYELIDFFIYQQLTYHKTSKDILEEAKVAFAGKYDEDTIKSRLISYYRRFTNSQFKRSTAVDGPNITGRSFSPRVGFKIPSDMSSDVYIKGLNE